jgi:hypothetical protein
VSNQHQTVYVALLNEGTDVWRPTLARHVEGDLYELLATPDYDEDDEEWQFVPLSIVQCRRDEAGLLKAIQKEARSTEIK